MIAKSRGSIFKSTVRSKPLNLLKMIMTEKEVQNLISSEPDTHFDSVFSIFQDLKQSVMLKYETEFQ